jgi:hypothetical protein
MGFEGESGSLPSGVFSRGGAGGPLWHHGQRDATGERSVSLAKMRGTTTHILRSALTDHPHQFLKDDKLRTPHTIFSAMWSYLAPSRHVRAFQSLSAPSCGVSNSFVARPDMPMPGLRASP